MLSVEYRNDLYYGKYRYKGTIKVMGMIYTHFSKTFDDFVRKMKKYQTTQPKGFMRVFYSEDATGKIVSDVVNFEEIKKYYDFIEENKQVEYTKNRATHKVSFFSNDLDFIKNLSILDEKVEIKECIVGKKECMYFKNKPKFKYRTYFSPNLPMPKDFDQSIINLLENYKNGVGLSWSLIKYAYNYNEQGHQSYLWNTYIEYDDVKMQTILHLTFGGILGKTYICEQKPKI